MASYDPQKKYRIIRDCCRDGYCLRDHQAKTLGRPGRVVHITKLSGDKVQKFLDGWQDYNPVAEPESR